MIRAKSSVKRKTRILRACTLASTCSLCIDGATPSKKAGTGGSDWDSFCGTVLGKVGLGCSGVGLGTGAGG